MSTLHGLIFRESFRSEKTLKIESNHKQNTAESTKSHRAGNVAGAPQGKCRIWDLDPSLLLLVTIMPSTASSLLVLCNLAEPRPCAECLGMPAGGWRWLEEYRAGCWNQDSVTSEIQLQLLGSWNKLHLRVFGAWESRKNILCFALGSLFKARHCVFDKHKKSNLSCFSEKQSSEHPNGAYSNPVANDSTV